MTVEEATKWEEARTENNNKKKNIYNSTNQLLNYFQFVSSRVLNTLHLSSYISHHLVTKGGHLKFYLKIFFT